MSDRPGADAADELFPEQGLVDPCPQRDHRLLSASRRSRLDPGLEFFEQPLQRGWSGILESIPDLSLTCSSPLQAWVPDHLLLNSPLRANRRQTKGKRG